MVAGSRNQVRILRSIGTSFLRQNRRSLESFRAVVVKTMRRRRAGSSARAVRMAASSVSTVRAIRGPQKCFPNLASFRPVDAESEIAFSKKDETFQESQGILSPLRLPVPPRPLWSGDQILSVFFGQVE